MYLFNKSLVSGVFPDDLQCARVTPLFKQGEPSDLNNCVRGTRTQPLICVVREVFSRLHFRRRHTFASF